MVKCFVDTFRQSVVDSLDAPQGIDPGAADFSQPTEMFQQ